MIQFRCTRCQHVVESTEEKIGKKMYCPVCYLEIIVPPESTIKEIDESQLYATNTEPIDAREIAKRQKSVSLRCPICNTNIAVEEEQIGKILICPECETKVRVPKSISTKFKLAEEKRSKLNQLQNNQTNEPTQHELTQQNNIYEISGNNTTTPQNKTIRVYCKLCGTLMYALESQVGEELTCPDCETKTVVVVPKKSAPISTQQQNTTASFSQSVFEGKNTFEVAGDVPQYNNNILLVPVVCSLCGTRMYAGEDEIGGFKICPDCGRQNEIKPVPKAERIKPDLTNGSYNVGQVNELEERPVLRTLTDYRFVDGSLDKELYSQQYDSTELSESLSLLSTDSDTYATTPSDSPTSNTRQIATTPTNRIDHYLLVGGNVPCLPRHPFLSRIFLSFMCGVLCGRLVVGCFLVVFGVVFTCLCPGMLVVIGGMMGVVLVVGGLFFISDTFYTLFSCTMVGNDLPDREDWNEFRLIEFGATFIWLLFLLSISLLPSYLLRVFFGLSGDLMSILLLSGGSVAIFFPIFFLSCIESNSGFVILSQETCRSLLCCVWGWVRFYFISFLLLTIFLAISFAIVSIANNTFANTTQELIIITTSLITPIWTFFTILYSRFLGRLSWIIEESIKKRKQILNRG
jgi:DNA-directed RNA polymerase subunit M/transcription elongation factor TFIIS